MSFFGFDTALPKDAGHSSRAPGFGQTLDAFAGLSGAIDAGDVYAFHHWRLDYC